MMKRFAIALTVFVTAMSAAGAALAQSSIAEQMRLLRERRAGGGNPGAAQTANLDGAALAEAKGCLQCHAVNATVYGPAWINVAAKYEYSVDDIVKLMESIRNGSQGTWAASLGSNLAMPANRLVNEEEAKKLATWILKLKK